MQKSRDPERLARLFRGLSTVDEQVPTDSNQSAHPNVEPDVQSISRQSDHASSKAEPQEISPRDFVGMYLTIIDYAPELQQFDPAFVANFLIDQAPIEHLLAALSVLSHTARIPDEMPHLSHSFAQVLPVQWKERFEALALDERMHTLALQWILHAFRLALVRGERTFGHVLDFHPVAIGVFLAHTIPLLSQLSRLDPESSNDERYRNSLASDLVPNMLFSRREDPWAKIDRHSRIWNRLTVQQTRGQLRARPDRLLKEATGLEFKDILAFGFQLYSYARKLHEHRRPRFFGDLEANETDKFGRFIALVSHTSDKFAEKLKDETDDWDFIEFMQRPVIQLDDGFLVIDEDLLLGRILDGLYYDVLDHERENHSPDASARWAEAYGDIAESITEEQLCLIASTVSDAGATFTASEDDFEPSYEGRRCDFIMILDNTLCLFEVHGGQLHSKTRFHGDLDQLESDADRMVVQKLLQVLDTFESLSKDPSILPGFSDYTYKSTIPVVVSGGSFPVNSVSMRAISARLPKDKEIDGSFLDRLSIVNLAELEMLEALSERGESVPGLLLEWTNSSLSSMPLSYFLRTRFLERSDLDFRPARMHQPVKDTLEQIIKDLQLMKKT